MSRPCCQWLTGKLVRYRKLCVNISVQSSRQNLSLHLLLEKMNERINKRKTLFKCQRGTLFTRISMGQTCTLALMNENELTFHRVVAQATPSLVVDRERYLSATTRFHLTLEK